MKRKTLYAICKWGQEVLADNEVRPINQANEFDQCARQISKMMVIDIRLTASMIIDV